MLIISATIKKDKAAKYKGLPYEKADKIAAPAYTDTGGDVGANFECPTSSLNSSLQCQMTR